MYKVLRKSGNEKVFHVLKLFVLHYLELKLKISAPQLNLASYMKKSYLSDGKIYLIGGGGVVWFWFFKPQICGKYCLLITSTVETCLIHRTPFINLHESPLQSIAFKVLEIHHIKWNKTSSFTQIKRKILQKYNGFKVLKMPVLCICAFSPHAYIRCLLKIILSFLKGCDNP